MPDAIVIGGGVMGLAAARELRRRGLRVLLLERAQPGRAASWASAGIIGATTRDEDDPTYHLRHVSHALWPTFADELRDESGTDPEYRENGCLYLAADEAELAWLQRVQAQRASASSATASQVTTNAGPTMPGQRARPDAERTLPEDGARHGTEPSLLDQHALREAEPALSSELLGALLVAGGNVEPRRLCRALEISARRLGVEMRDGVEVRALSIDGDQVTGVETEDDTFAADIVVLAAGAWSGVIDGVQPRAPVRPQKGQILALDQVQVGVRHVLLTAGDPYFVPRCDGRLVVGATREEAGWDASLTAGGVAWLLERAMAVVPGLRNSPIAEMWTGFRPLSADGLPMIGAGALRGLYFLTGHGPSGISPLPGSVALLASLIVGEPPPMSPERFSPLRFSAVPTS
jgi:glycine oxidase